MLEKTLESPLDCKDPALPCPPESKNLPRPELSDHVGGRAGPHGRAPGLWASHRRPRGPATPSAGKRRQSTAVRTAPFSSRALATVLAPPHTSCRAQPSDAPAPSLHLGFSKSEAQGACTPRLLCATLRDPMHYSLPGSSVHRDSPGKNTGVVCHALL